MVLRAASNNQTVASLKIPEVFDVSNKKLQEDSNYSIPKDSMTNIEERRYTPPSYSYGAYKGYPDTGKKGNKYTGYNYGLENDVPDEDW